MADGGDNAFPLMFDASELFTKHVTVYTDRAEVKKLIHVNVTKGPNDLIVRNLSPSIQSDSIRVDGLGKAIILEVQYKEKPHDKKVDIPKMERELNDKLKQLSEEKAKLNKKLLSVERLRNVLEKQAERLNFPCSKTDAENGIDTLDKFLSYYEKRMNDMDAQTSEIQKRIEESSQQISSVENDIKDTSNVGDSMIREVMISLESTEEGPVELDLIYIVVGASWTPTYDIRVLSEEKLFKVVYYALVQQSTGEDWIDTKLTLSTAVPIISGQAPEATTLKVSFRKSTLFRKSSLPKDQPRTPRRVRAMSMFAEHGDDPLQEEAIMVPARHSVTNIPHNAGRTCVDIMNPSNVPSDNVAHKVIIAMVDLMPIFEYETIPSKSPFAFLNAKAKNTSIYSFLPGPSSIFLDNNFVAKSYLEAVCPSEEIFCALGVDQSIRIEYKPVRRFLEESGILSKTSFLTHEKTIEVINSKSHAIKIRIIEHLPLSEEEKLKVVLDEPTANKPEKEPVFKVNKQNNVEWELSIASNESRSVVIRYHMEYPKGEQLEYEEQ